jgi:hypothetical protein
MLILGTRELHGSAAQICAMEMSLAKCMDYVKLWDDLYLRSFILNKWNV